MHVLYIHQNFPAQFGHIASAVSTRPGWKCTFVSRTAAGRQGSLEKIKYTLAGGARKENHFCSRTFENNIWHCDAIYTALAARADIQPDLIVAHSGFGSSLFLRDLYRDVPVINLFEHFYRPGEATSDMEFRGDLGWPIDARTLHRARCRNAMILLDLNNCEAGYCPTEFQRSLFPTEYQPKLRRIFDGIDRSVFHGYGDALRPPLGIRGHREILGIPIPPTTRIVTYVSRGFESMRGFDIFMRAAALIAARFPDVRFFVVGSDQAAYGGDENFTKPFANFKDWVLARGQYDLSRFSFVGQINPRDLARLLATSDLHIYLTVPFVLSWSMVDAMSCGAVVLGSRTAPVMEMIHDGQNGLLADFFRPEEFADKAVKVLADPDAFRSLGQAAEQIVDRDYSITSVLPTMLAFYEQVQKAGIQR